MSTVLMKLEGFAGHSIDRVLCDACMVAKRCGCWAKININGIEVLIGPSDDPERLWENYRVAQDRGASFVSANVIPNPPRSSS